MTEKIMIMVADHGGGDHGGGDDLDDNSNASDQQYWLFLI